MSVNEIPGQAPRPEQTRPTEGTPAPGTTGGTSSSRANLDRALASFSPDDRKAALEMLAAYTDAMRRNPGT